LAAGPLAAGAALGPYRVEGVLGEGGMGVIYRARRDPDGDVVALKVLRAELAADPVYRQRFLREARAAAEVDHPHLVPIVDAGNAGDTPYLAVGFVAGRSPRESPTAGRSRSTRRCRSLHRSVPGSMPCMRRGSCTAM
jgi:serine/threonine protein kinase